ncbi:MAG TPA: ATP-binding protein [Bryobacteraceae bacterium]|nr:ATP-binding protein [Bryobacteraceae bacterium]
MKPRSIGFRLAAWYFAVFTCGLAIFSVATWFAMRASLFEAVDDELQDRVHGIAQFMQKDIATLSPSGIRDEFREHSMLGPDGDLFQVCDEQGKWLYRSVPLESANIPIALPASTSNPHFEDLDIGGSRLRVYSRRISVGGKSYTVQVASVMDEAYEALGQFRIILLLTAPFLLFVASATGYWLSARALAPVDSISGTAQRISIENLDERLSVPQTGDQLQRLSETLNAMLSRLALSVRRMKQFTADASHELRAPVSLIRTTAEVAVQRRDRPAQEYLQALDEILEESVRTSQVVDSLMLLARSDSGKEAIELHLVDMCAVVRNAAEQGEKLVRNRRSDFSAQISDGPVWIDADPDALRRALLILIDNAAKYTPPGGSVAIQFAVEESLAVATVSDTGIGIASEDIPHIFDRFWRADKARSREQGGAGLGLSIARWIVEAHRGSIDVESESGRGSSFHLRLPLAS